MKKILQEIDSKSSSEVIQTEIYELGKKHNFENLRDFFKLIYQVLLGQDQGPRLGSFIKLYGIEKTINLIDNVVNDSN
jgi:lysyl-tRNA synthetase class 1